MINFGGIRIKRLHMCFYGFLYKSFVSCFTIETSWLQNNQLKMAQENERQRHFRANLHTLKRATFSDCVQAGKERECFRQLLNISNFISVE